MSQPLRVLILEDRPSDARLEISELRQAGFEITSEVVDTEEQFLEALGRNWDVILADYSLPQFDAPRALQLLHEHKLDIPFIIISGTIGEETAVAVMKQGAVDYLLKDRLGRLGQAVTQALEQRRLRESQRQLVLERDKLLRQLQLQIARMPLGYLLLDVDLCIVDWNPAAEKIFGFRKEEVLGMGPPYEKILPATGWQEAESILHRLKAGDMSAHIVTENSTKDGRTITCEWINTPLVENGEFHGLVSLAQDVTDRKHLEEQYRQAQKMEAVGKLAGGVAHDFNNMLTIILGYSDLLKESLRHGDPLRELVQQIEEAGNRAARLTRQLLAFSRKQVLAPVVVDSNALLNDMKNMLSRLIGEDIELTFRNAEKLWRVRVDPGQMEQVVMNLVVNSRDAMPQGGKLTIETANVELDAQYAAAHADAREGEHIVLAVTDTGCGMDRATQARIFEPFSSTKGEMGTGLGLATVYGIVKQSGGHVAVYSEPGRGTTFKVYLPRDPESVTKPRTLPAAKTDWHGSETVLLVEDEDAVRSLARMALQRHGYKILEARHGGEALLTCEQHKGEIHLLATDVVMPQMSGRELADRLLLLRPAMKVLYMSGYMDDAIVRHGLIDAGTAFLQKPFTPDGLVQKVREVLDGPVPQPAQQGNTKLP